jgi:hypothetical protein
LILPAAEKSIGQYLLEAFNGSNNPADFNAFAINYEQKYPLYYFYLVQSKSDSCLNNNL